MTTAAVAPEAPAPPKLSTVSRIINTFIAPSQTFTDLKHHATWTSWLAPFVVLAIMSYVYVGVVAKVVTFEQVSQNQMRFSPKQAERVEQLPPDQRARAERMSLMFTKAISLGYPLWNLFWLAIVAAVLMATFNFGVGAEVPYRTSLAIVYYASLPEVLTTILAVASLLAGADPEGFAIQNPVATNLGHLIENPSAHLALYSLGSAVDVVMIWVLVLTAVGFSRVSKMNRFTTMSVVFGWYMLKTLVGAGFALLAG